jgi:hypothetical protein
MTCSSVSLRIKTAPPKTHVLCYWRREMLKSVSANRHAAFLCGVEHIQNYRNSQYGASLFPPAARQVSGVRMCIKLTIALRTPSLINAFFPCRSKTSTAPLLCLVRSALFLRNQRVRCSLAAAAKSSEVCFSPETPEPLDDCQPLCSFIGKFICCCLNSKEIRNYSTN